MRRVVILQTAITCDLLATIADEVGDEGAGDFFRAGAGALPEEERTQRMLRLGLLRTDRERLTKRGDGAARNLAAHLAAGVELRPGIFERPKRSR